MSTAPTRPPQTPPPVVTVGIPVYKRLETLPFALRAVAAQDYAHIELLVSDNGQNGEALDAIIRANWPHPYRVHRHPVTVSVTANFNTLVNLAKGEYFVLLCDDDTISADFVSDLVGLLQTHPRAALAIPQHAKMDDEQQVYWRSTLPRPTVLAGEEFLSRWAMAELELESSAVTQMARTQLLRSTGGYPDLPLAMHADDAVWVRLALGREVVMARSGCFNWRVAPNSTGHSAPHTTLAQAVREYMAMLDTDPVIQAHAQLDPRGWPQLRKHLRMGATKYYLASWLHMYRPRMPLLGWIRSAFQMPFVARYYRRVLMGLLVNLATRGRRAI